MSSLLGSADRWLGTPGRYLSRHHDLGSALLGAAGLTVIAVVLIPIRDIAGAANIGLAMALVVGLVGITAGLMRGVAVALWAAMLFVLLHSVPHGLPRIETAEDAVTGVLLLVTGVLAGLVHQRSARLERSVKEVDHELERMHRVGEAAARPVPAADVMDVVAREIESELDLKRCYWEAGSTASSYTELQHNGLIAGVSHDADAQTLGMELVAGVTIEIPPAGRLVLIGRDGARPTMRQLKVSVILADYAAAVTTLHA